MKQDEIIEMARQAGLDPDLWNYTDAFEAFAKLVAAKERDACAKVCESHGPTLANSAMLAEEIRERDEA